MFDLSPVVILLLSETTVIRTRTLTLLEKRVTSSVYYVKHLNLKPIRKRTTSSGTMGYVTFSVFNRSK